MIDEAFLHFEGIGPARLEKLNKNGIRSWYDAVADPDRLPAAKRDNLLRALDENIHALESRDVGFFADRLAGPDRWRLLSEFLEETSYFDIETFGLEYDAPITTIVVWHKGEVHSFVEHENLDDFLELLEDVRLMASFNGASFDVPRVLDAFHIPTFPCPHIDLRWLAFHKGMRGGLKEITVRAGVRRPSDLADADGALAIKLWSRWIHFQDSTAREQLIRYCAADVILLVFLAQQLGERPDFDTSTIWSKLPELTDTAETDDSDSCTNRVLPLGESGQARKSPESPFGNGSPSRLRARRTG
ncbi:MAG: ribonuclease H-like domain-containing protein [Planctomycetales bacterium]|nr:ribonuclease H-like domain-containing protein [Planctomycetales bacterium]